MPNTKLSIKGEKFYINDKITYSEIPNSNINAHGLLMNARFIQGIFDDKADRNRYNRFEKQFDPEKNTDDLIVALPEWYKYGLRAFTVGFQGGGPCFTIKNDLIDNNPYSEDGKSIDINYRNRMDRLIKAADKLGIIVIVNFFYGSQAKKLNCGETIINATRAASKFLKEGGYTNVIIDIANEQDISEFINHPLLHTGEGIATLIEIAKQASGGMPIGCSLSGGKSDKEIAKASDVILIHGNACSRGRYYNLIKQVREFAPGKPVVCNEDSQAIGQLEVAYKTKSSWGYYNNMTKQEPPTDWGITKGEDEFYAYRMAEGIGIEVSSIAIESQYYLQGLEDNMIYEGKQWIRVASLYPETINYVDFHRNGELIYTSYDEPFSVNYDCNWFQEPCVKKDDDREWKAVIHLRDGQIISKIAK